MSTPKSEVKRTFAGPGTKIMLRLKEGCFVTEGRWSYYVSNEELLPQEWALAYPEDK